MKDRLSKFLTSEGLTTSMLAEELKVHSSGVRHILSGRNHASYDFIKKILERYPRINAEWLILGQGAMYKAGDNRLMAASESLISPDSTDLAASYSASEHEIKKTPEKIQAKTEVAKNQDESVRLPSLPSVDSTKKIEMMMVLYSDKTFKTYVANE